MDSDSDNDGERPTGLNGTQGFQRPVSTADSLCGPCCRRPYKVGGLGRVVPCQNQTFIRSPIPYSTSSNNNNQCSSSRLFFSPRHWSRSRCPERWPGRSVLRTTTPVPSGRGRRRRRPMIRRARWRAPPTPTPTPTRTR